MAEAKIRTLVETAENILNNDGMLRCNQCQVSVPVDEIRDHISEAHGSDPIGLTTQSLSSASPPVTGAPYSSWEEYERELTED